MNMFRNRLFSMPVSAKAALCVFACLSAQIGCDPQVAGTSVGTGNPTEIEVGFRDDTGAETPVTGTLSVYASTQIPVEGYAPQPLLTVDVSDAAHAMLKSAAFATLADSSWPKGSRNDSEYFFNVVVTGADRGAVLKGFKRNKNGVFGLREGDTYPDAGLITAKVKSRMAQLVAFQGKIDTANFSVLHDYHLFIYGTGYKAKVEHGIFSMPLVPQGKYDGYLLALPKPDHPMSGIDSTSVFSLSSSLEPGSPNLVLGGVYEQVLLPDSLRVP